MPELWQRIGGIQEVNSYSRSIMGKDTVVFVLTTSGASQQVQLNGVVPGKKYVVRWIQYTGTNYPADNVLYISGFSDNGLDFGNATSTATVTSGSRKSLPIPLAAVTGTFIFGYPAEAIDKSTNGIISLKDADSKWTFTVSSNAVAIPTFTSLTVCIQSV